MNLHIRDRIHKTTEALISSVYPNRCPCCGRIQNDSGICAGRYILLKRIPKDGCLMCGQPKVVCECSVRPMRTDGFTAPFFNEGRAQKGMYRFKFGGAVRAAEFYAHAMAERFKEMFPDVTADAVCCVPADKVSVRSRGYNQAQVLAQLFAKETGIEFCGSILTKVRRNKTQHSRSYRERSANVKGIYAVTAPVEGKTIIVIDDIRTTGATINECADILKKANAANVYAVTALLGRNLQ